jgi:hypothetical protein
MNNKLKMKNILLISLLISCLFSTCRYEEHAASLTPVKNRIRGSWIISKVLKNGIADATARPSEAESYQAIFEFYKSGHLSIRYMNGNISRSATGNWYFGDKKKSIHAKFDSKYVSFVREYIIIKFSNKELKVRFTDDQNTVWTLVFTLQQSYIPYGY